jgi:hypothetical protein
MKENLTPEQIARLKQIIFVNETPIDTNETPGFYKTCAYLERLLQKRCDFPLHFQATCRSVGIYYEGTDGFFLNPHLSSADADLFTAAMLLNIGIKDALDSIKTIGSPYVGKEAIARFAESHKAEIWAEYQQRQNSRLEAQHD